MSIIYSGDAQGGCSVLHMLRGLRHTCRQATAMNIGVLQHLGDVVQSGAKSVKSVNFRSIIKTELPNSSLYCLPRDTAFLFSWIFEKYQVQGFWQADRNSTVPLHLSPSLGSLYRPANSTLVSPTQSFVSDLHGPKRESSQFSFFFFPPGQSTFLF